MKKTLCLLVVLCITMSLFNVVFALDGDKQLEEAILKAKEILQIDDNEYVIENFRNGNNGYELSWKLKDEDKNGWINAIIKNNELSSYYKSSNEDVPRLAITDMTPEGAEKIAEEFLIKAAPTAFSSSKHTDTIFNGYSGGIYNVTYQRYENDIPVNNQMISVSVSTQKNEVTEFYTSFDKRLQFEDTQNIITFEEADKSFKENFGYELKYIKKYDKEGKSPNAYLAYVPKSDFYNKYIDAKTGKIFKTDYASQNIQFAATANKNMAMGLKEESAMDTAYVLSEEEKILSSEVANLPSENEIIKTIKNIFEFKIDDTYKESNFTIYKYSNGKYFADVEFSKNSGEEKEYPHYFYKSIKYNLTDKKIENYYANSYKNEGKEADVKLCRKQAEAFINKYYNDESKFITHIDKGNGYSYYFERTYDGIGVKSEGITLNFDKYSGEIVSVNYTWGDLTFDSKDNIKSIEEFYKTVITEDELKPTYITYTSYDENGNRNQVLETKLVYILDDYTSNYSAVTLEKIGYSGEIVKENEYNYIDIENHYVKKYAQKLAQIGIGLEGNELKPDESITKGDYLALIAKANDDWYEPLNEEWAKQLVRRGMIEEDDKNLDELVKRIDAVRFMVNNLGYKEIARKYEIYNCPFKDVVDEMRGYATLGAALNIVSDSTDILNADKYLTRADALIIVYNFLSRE